MQHEVESLVIREARSEDVEAVVHLMNDGGPDGNPREILPSPLPRSYFEAFEKIRADEKAKLMVVELNAAIVGTFHLVFITYLAGKGREDAQVEAVHVGRAHRNKGIGTLMMDWVIEAAKKRNCRRVQLTTNKARTEAHRFYERLGFIPSHVGMKLPL